MVPPHLVPQCHGLFWIVGFEEGVDEGVVGDHVARRAVVVVVGSEEEEEEVEGCGEGFGMGGEVAEEEVEVEGGDVVVEF